MSRLPIRNRFPAVFGMVILCAAGTLFQGCHKSRICREEERAAAGMINTVAAPSHIAKGKKVPITVAVQNNDTFCVKRVEGSIEFVEPVFFRISANLIHTGTQAESTCDCLKDSVLYTQVFFQPQVSGVFFLQYIVSDGSTVNGGSNKIVEIVVD